MDGLISKSWLSNVDWKVYDLVEDYLMNRFSKFSRCVCPR